MTTWCSMAGAGHRPGGPPLRPGPRLPGGSDCGGHGQLSHGRGGQESIADDDFTPESEIWRALVLGTRDYVIKCGFSGVLLGLSGGIDSSIVAAIAASALGPENVLGVLMPSPFTSRSSMEDAQALAQNLGIRTMTLGITEIMRSFDRSWPDLFRAGQRM